VDVDDLHDRESPIARQHGQAAPPISDDDLPIILGSRSEPLGLRPDTILEPASAPQCPGPQQASRGWPLAQQLHQLEAPIQKGVPIHAIAVGVILGDLTIQSLDGGDPLKVVHVAMHAEPGIAGHRG
jgi:hypothetical protein